MALTDIVFNQGEGQDFILELPVGILGTPLDLLVSDPNLGAILEAPEAGGSIFIMSE
jgi:hypothetical protein